MPNTLQERYSNMVMAKLRDAIVIKDSFVCNNDYEGEPTAGAVKIPVRDTEVVVSDYDRANGITGTNSVTGYETIVVDKDKAINEIVDGYESSAIPDGILAERLDSAGYSLAHQLDIDASSELVKGSTFMPGMTQNLAVENIYDALIKARTTLTKNGVPNDDRRFLLVTPEAEAMILKSDDFISASELGDSVKVTGSIGKILGFNVFSGWMPKEDGVLFVVGHPKFFTRVREFSVPVHTQDLSGSGKYIGASAVQGRLVYAHKVLRSKAFLKFGSSINSGESYVTVTKISNGVTLVKVNKDVKVFFKQSSSSITATKIFGEAMSSTEGYTEVTDMTNVLTSAGKYVEIIVLSGTNVVTDTVITI